MKRRDTIKALGSSAGLLGLFGGISTTEAREAAGTPSYAAGMKPIKITKIRAIATAPQGSNLIVVKVETVHTRTSWEAYF